MLTHKMITYKQLGYIYRLLKQHQKAINCFKKQLQLAWFNDDMIAEMQAYEGLSIDYFYAGSIQKSKYYDNKYKLGEFEGPNAVVRQAAVSLIKNKIEEIKNGTINRKDKGKQDDKKKTSFDRMPSPSTFGGK